MNQPTATQEPSSSYASLLHGLCMLEELIRAAARQRSLLTDSSPASDTRAGEKQTPTIFPARLRSAQKGPRRRRVTERRQGRVNQSGRSA